MRLTERLSQAEAIAVAYRHWSKDASHAMRRLLDLGFYAIVFVGEPAAIVAYYDGVRFEL